MAEGDGCFRDGRHQQPSSCHKRAFIVDMAAIISDALRVIIITC